ncbi:MAG: hypothetical protein ACLVES_02090 [Faecalibacterium prausnitzii]
MTEAMPFLQKTILLSYDPRPLPEGRFLRSRSLLFYRRPKAAAGVLRRFCVRMVSGRAAAAVE